MEQPCDLFQAPLPTPFLLQDERSVEQFLSLTARLFKVTINAQVSVTRFLTP